MIISKLKFGTEASPMIDIIKYVNKNCENSTIYLGSFKDSEFNFDWESMIKDFKKINKIVPYNV